jgi:ribosomal protein S8
MDIISQLIITIKNGSLVGKESVLVPYSKLKNAILACLEKEGFIASYSKKIAQTNIINTSIIIENRNPSNSSNSG